MAASSGVARPIYPFRIKNNATGVAETQRISEKLGQTFLQGTPVQIDVAGATGFIIANPAIVSVATAIIAGISQENGHNLATSGGQAGGPLDLQLNPPASGGIGVIASTGQGVPNQPSASVMAIGSPQVFGSVGLWVANDISTFIGVYGDSNTAANATLAQAQVGTLRGLTKDAGNNFWYVDNFITTTAAGACLEIVSLVDPIGTLNGRVEFRISHAAQQLAT
jgi:hypothetical protein